MEFVWEKAPQVPDTELQRFLDDLARAIKPIRLIGEGIGWYSGTGSPETVVFANIGSLYSRTDGGASTTLYVKESGNGLATGWVAK